MDSIKTTDPTVLVALAATCQDELDKRVNFENSFAYFVPVCPVAAKAAKKTKVPFDANVSGAAGGIFSPGGGLGGVCVYLSSGFKGQCFNSAIPITKSYRWEPISRKR
jgi:hypothetical protein